MIQITEEERHQLVETRRDLHRHPETAFEEKRTAAVVADRLRNLGYRPATGIARTGVVATLSGKSEGECVLLRADMDALPIQEQNGEEYASTIEGAMHACGHDGHTSIVLGVARLLRRLPAPDRGTIKFLFQPAEETANGARAMIDEGVLESPRVDAAFGLHLWNYLDVGKVAVADGPIMAAADEFDVRVIGRGCHGAKPNEGRDPVLAAGQIVTALQQIASRIVDPMKPVVITVGSIHGGDTFNVIPEEVRITGTVRCFDNEVWESIPGRFQEVVEQTARAFLCEAKVRYQRNTRPVVNDPGMSELVREAAREVVGERSITEIRTMGSEDFGEYLHRVPGCFFFVGSRNERKGRIHPHHSPRFDIDEAALPIGVQLLATVAQRYLGRF